LWKHFWLEACSKLALKSQAKMLKIVGGSWVKTMLKAQVELQTAENGLRVLGQKRNKCLDQLGEIAKEITLVERKKSRWQTVLNEPHEEEAIKQEVEEVEGQEEDEEEGVEEEAMEEEEEAVTPMDEFDAVASESEDEVWRKKIWKMDGQWEEEEEDMEEEEQAEEEEEERAEEEGGENELKYAWRWRRQGGDDHGIPKEYTPCKFFFNAFRGCVKGEECQFSHNGDIFGRAPFSTVWESLRWGRKQDCKTRQEEAPRRRSPRQRHPEEAPPKKTRRPARGSSSHAEDAPRRSSHVKEEDDEEDAPMPKRGPRAFKRSRR